MNHRLGNGAKFYGKRKSNIYGENDSMRKKNRYVEDPKEDYQGPRGAGYFVWKKNEDGVMEARSRMKGTLIDPLAIRRKEEEKLEKVFQREMGSK